VSLRVAVDEAHALEVLDLLCRGRAIRIVPDEPLAQPRPALAELAARRLALASVRLLAEHGRRERAVLRHGRRVHGRVWDPRVNDGFRLRFTAASFELWVQTTQRLADIARAAEVVEGQGSSKRARRQIRRIIKIADTDTGDWLFYALAYRHLGRVDMPAEIREDLGRRLCMGSPLATLFALDARLVEDGGPLADHLAPLFTGPSLRLLECLGDLLADQWTEQLGACMTWTPGDQRAARLGAAAAVLEAFLELLDARRRLDLCAPLCRALVRLLETAWSDPAELRMRILAGAALPRLADQDALRRALARVVQLAERVLGLRDALARETFGDARYEEGQLVLALVDDAVRPHQRRFAALAGALTGRLG
jgi:hypothetical protein